MENTKYFMRRLPLGAILFAAIASVSLQAQADTWACEVALCLANPQGPTAAPACLGPIQRLWRQLAKGGGIPTCWEANTTAAPDVRTEQATGENCPPGYSYWGGSKGTELMCSMQGAVTTYKNGQPEKRTWWNEQGQTVDEVFTQSLPGANVPAGNLQ